MKKNEIVCGMIGLVLLGLTSCSALKEKHASGGNGQVAACAARPLNPIVPQGVFIADPEVRQMPDGETMRAPGGKSLRNLLRRGEGT